MDKAATSRAGPDRQSWPSVKSTVDSKFDAQSASALSSPREASASSETTESRMGGLVVVAPSVGDPWVVGS